MPSRKSLTPAFCFLHVLIIRLVAWKPLDSLPTSLRLCAKVQERKPKIKTHALPYIHRLAHNVKKVAARYNVRVVFSALCKLAKICPMMAHKPPETCSKKHETRYTECVSNVIYNIPLSCGRVYIGQTGRCFNDRVREHRSAVDSNVGGHLAVHCKRCGCAPLLEQTTFIRRAREKTKMELI